MPETTVVAGRRTALPWLGVAAAIVVLDQITKIWVMSVFQPYETLPVTPFFNLVLVFNTGAAFNFLADAGGWQKWFFVVLAAAICVWLYTLLRAHAQERALPLAAAGIMGGAVGNVIDRLRIDRVIDFIQVHWAGWYFPAFNVADSAITLGVALMLWQQFRHGEAN